jgi:hypothetical protein
MHGRKIKSFAAIACAVAFCWLRPVAALAGPEETEEAQRKAAYEKAKNRLVYIERLLVKSDADCTQKSFENTTRQREQGTGYLLTSQYILTALHVAGTEKQVEPGQIRCFAIWRETNKGDLKIARPRMGGDVERPNLAGPELDLAILQLREPVADVTSCPEFWAARMERGKIVFINGYDGAAIKFNQGLGVTDALTNRTSLQAPCESGLCSISQPVPAGNSGAPVTDQSYSLVGVMKGGNNYISFFEPLSGARRELDDICKPFNSGAYCERIRAERENEKPFEVPITLRCNSAGQSEGATRFLVDYPAPEGYKISGFVTHKDNDIARVGHAEYRLSRNRLYVEGVRIELSCNGRPTASGKAEDAETVVSGRFKKNLSAKDKDVINTACNKQ